MDALMQDVRLALRVLAKNRGFTAVSAFVLALGIGANTVAFAIVNALFLRPLPLAHPEELVRVYLSSQNRSDWSWLSYPDFTEIRDRLDVFSGVATEKPIALSLAAAGRAERVWGAAANGDYFAVLGLTPALGRFFLPEEDRTPGTHPVVVLSYRSWKERFASDPAIVGRTLLLNGYAFTVVGVAPQGFGGTNVGYSAEMWAPMMMQERLPGLSRLDHRTSRGLYVLGRLAPGRTLHQARAAAAVLADSLTQTYPDAYRGSTFTLIPERQGSVHPMMRGEVLGFTSVLTLVIALVLLLACANVAGLWLVRAASRRKEVSVRLALGASRRRVARQLLTESTLLSLFAGGLGLLIAWLGVRLLSTLRLPIDFPISLDVVVDPLVLGFSFLVSVGTGILFGLAPAFQVSALSLSPALRDGASGAQRRRLPLRSALVLGQVALSTVLLVGAGLFLRSLWNAERIRLGFDPGGVVLASVDLGLQGYDDTRGRDFMIRLRDGLERLPGVDSVSMAEVVPFDFDIQRWSAAPEGYVPPPDGSLPSVDRNIVAPGYFKTLRIPLVEGRDFTEADAAGSPRVVIVNQILAEKFWPGGSAVGKRLGVPGRWMAEVIGVVSSLKYSSLGEDPKPYFYFAFRQAPTLDMTFHVRATGALSPPAVGAGAPTINSEGDPAALANSIRDVVRSMDAALPVYELKLMTDHVRVALAPARAGAVAVGSFGAVALVLASVGLYGVLAYSVAQRTHEIGIRRALGAQNHDVFAVVVKQALFLTASGLTLGLLLSFGLVSFVKTVLYGIRPVEPGILALTSIVLLLVAAGASYLPARRAARVDPLAALRYE